MTDIWRHVRGRESRCVFCGDPLRYLWHPFPVLSSQEAGVGEQQRTCLSLRSLISRWNVIWPRHSVQINWRISLGSLLRRLHCDLSAVLSALEPTGDGSVSLRRRCVLGKSDFRGPLPFISNWSFPSCSRRCLLDIPRATIAGKQHKTNKASRTKTWTCLK
jgi:hypothetical protein